MGAKKSRIEIRRRFEKGAGIEKERWRKRRRDGKNSVIENRKGIEKKERELNKCGWKRTNSGKGTDAEKGTAAKEKG